MSSDEEEENEGEEEDSDLGEEISPAHKAKAMEKTPFATKDSSSSLLSQDTQRLDSGIVDLPMESVPPPLDKYEMYNEHDLMLQEAGEESLGKDKKSNNTQPSTTATKPNESSKDKKAHVGASILFGSTVTHDADEDYLVGGNRKQNLMSNSNFFARDFNYNNYRLTRDELMKQQMNEIVDDFRNQKQNALREAAVLMKNPLNEFMKGFNYQMDESKSFIVRQALSIKTEHRSSMSDKVIIDFLKHSCKLGPYLSNCSVYDMKAIADSTTMLDIFPPYDDSRKIHDALGIQYGDSISNLYILLMGNIEIDRLDPLLLDPTPESNNASNTASPMTTARKGSPNGKMQKQNSSRPQTASSPDKHKHIHHNKISLVQYRAQMFYEKHQEAIVSDTMNMGDMLGENIFQGELSWNCYVRSLSPSSVYASSAMDSLGSALPVTTGIPSTAAGNSTQQQQNGMVSLCRIPLTAIHQYIGRRGEAIEDYMMYFWKYVRLWPEIVKYNKNFVHTSLFTTMKMLQQQNSIDGSHQNAVTHAANNRKYGIHNDFQPMNVIECARMRTYHAGSVIFKQGTPRVYLYIIKQGSATYYRDFPTESVGEDIIPERVETVQQMLSNPLPTLQHGEVIDGERLASSNCGGVLLSNDFSFMDSDDSAVFQRIEYQDHQFLNITKDESDKVFEHRKRKYHRFFLHRNTLIATTRCEVCVIPIHEIAKCIPLFNGLVQLANLKYTAIMISNEEVIKSYYEKKQWQEHDRFECLDGIQREIQSRCLVSHPAAAISMKDDAASKKRFSHQKKSPPSAPQISTATKVDVSFRNGVSQGGADTAVASGGSNKSKVPTIDLRELEHGAAGPTPPTTSRSRATTASNNNRKKLSAAQQSAATPTAVDSITISLDYKKLEAQLLNVSKKYEAESKEYLQVMETNANRDQSHSRRPSILSPRPPSALAAKSSQQGSRKEKLNNLMRPTSSSMSRNKNSSPSPSPGPSPAEKAKTVALESKNKFESDDDDDDSFNLGCRTPPETSSNTYSGRRNAISVKVQNVHDLAIASENYRGNAISKSLDEYDAIANDIGITIAKNAVESKAFFGDSSPSRHGSIVATTPSKKTITNSNDRTIASPKRQSTFNGRDTSAIDGSSGSRPGTANTLNAAAFSALLFHHQNHHEDIISSAAINFSPSKGNAQAKVKKLRPEDYVQVSLFPLIYEFVFIILTSHYCICL